jgi:hypothetical protein
MFKLFKPVFALTLLALSPSAFAADAPGVTPSEIKIGEFFPSADLPRRSGSSAEVFWLMSSPSTTAAASTAGK